MTLNTYLGLEIREGNFLPFRIYICTSKIIKPYFKSVFLLHHLNLCGQAENSKWIMFSRQTGDKYDFFLIFDVQISISLEGFPRVQFHCRNSLNIVLGKDIFFWIFTKLSVLLILPYSQRFLSKINLILKEVT